MSFTNLVYFSLAGYFQFWAAKTLKRWQPFIIAITGTAGKSTTISLIEALLKPQIPIKVAYKANSITGIALDILKLKQQSFSLLEWLQLIFKAPIASRHSVSELVYLCELDSDRQSEMAYHTKLIHPDIVGWTSAYAMHTMNFPGEKEADLLESMVKDFGKIIEKTQKMAFLNADSDLIQDEIKTTSGLKGWITTNPAKAGLLKLISHSLSLRGTTATFQLSRSEFQSFYQVLQPKKAPPPIDSTITVSIPLAILSKNNMYGLGMAIIIGLLFDISLEHIQEKLKTWRLPPGRLSLFAGIKATTLLDSTYNSGRPATVEAIEILKKMGDDRTLAVLGDIRELGPLTRKEHERLATEIAPLGIKRLILVGPAMHDYALPVFIQQGYSLNKTIFAYQHPKLAAELITSDDFLQPGETILFKGSQNTLFLEGIVEQLLASPKDKHLLCRREPLWEQKRKAVYL